MGWDAKACRVSVSGLIVLVFRGAPKSVVLSWVVGLCPSAGGRGYECTAQKPLADCCFSGGFPRFSLLHHPLRVVQWIDIWKVVGRETISWVSWVGTLGFRWSVIRVESWDFRTFIGLCEVAVEGIAHAYGKSGCSVGSFLNRLVWGFGFRFSSLRSGLQSPE